MYCPCFKSGKGSLSYLYKILVVDCQVLKLQDVGFGGSGHINHRQYGGFVEEDPLSESLIHKNTRNLPVDPSIARPLC